MKKVKNFREGNVEEGEDEEMFVISFNRDMQLCREIFSEWLTKKVNNENKDIEEILDKAMKSLLSQKTNKVIKMSFKSATTRGKKRAALNPPDQPAVAKTARKKQKYEQWETV